MRTSGLCALERKVTALLVLEHLTVYPESATFSPHQPAAYPRFDSWVMKTSSYNI